MKKILCLIDNLGSGGAQRQLVNLSILLKNRGYSVSFAIYGRGDFYLPILNTQKINVYRIENKNHLGLIFKTRSYIRTQKPDVIIAFLETPGFLASVAGIGKKEWKLITSERSSKKSTFTSRRNRFYNWFERFADAKVCNSENAKTMWIEHYPQYKDKYHVIYNPVVIENRYNAGFEYKRNGKLHLVVAASYQELKNPLGLIDAIRMLSDKQRKQLIVDWYGSAEVTVGNTLIYDEAVKRVSDFSLESVIRLHEETTDIYNIMGQADVVGLFSSVEGLPNVICEAMTLGKPIIMSRVSDYEILANGNGILCDPTAESIAEGLLRLIECSQSELKRMGKISQEKAANLFSADTIIQQWVEVIDE